MLGNAIVIIIGAIGGTYITQRLLQASGTGLALFFATVGIILSSIINYFILRTALRSIDLLEHTVERIDRGDTSVRAPVETIDDPQFQHFAQSFNTMLGRLAAHPRMIEMHRAQLRQLSGQVVSAQEDERKRIARELHDDTSGALIARQTRVAYAYGAPRTSDGALPTGYTFTGQKVDASPKAMRILVDRQQRLQGCPEFVADMKARGRFVVWGACACAFQLEPFLCEGGLRKSRD